MPIIAPASEHRRPRHLGQRWNVTVDPLWLLSMLVAVAVGVAVLVWSAANPATPVPLSPAAVDVTAPSTTVAPPVVTTTSTTAPPPVIWSTTSTVYCEHTQLTKSSTVARDGVVAVSPGNFDRLVGTTWRVLDGPYAGKVLHVEDTGPAADFDIFVVDCATTSAYGRRAIHVQQVHVG